MLHICFYGAPVWASGYCFLGKKIRMEKDRSNRTSRHRSSGHCMPMKTWERMGFTQEDLIPKNLRLAAANRGAIYVAGRTLITVLHMGGRKQWMSFLVVENLNPSNQSVLGRDFVRSFDLMIDLISGMRRLRNPDRMFAKRPVNRTVTDENKIPIFLDIKVKLQPGQLNYSNVEVEKVKIFD